MLQVQSEVNGTTHIDIEEIRNFTNGLNYPLYYLDFETIGPAVPKYNGSRPYQQLVFQYSLHVQEISNSELEHREYLADPSHEHLSSMIKFYYILLLPFTILYTNLHDKFHSGC